MLPLRLDDVVGDVRWSPSPDSLVVPDVDEVGEVGKDMCGLLGFPLGGASDPFPHPFVLFALRSSPFGVLGASSPIFGDGSGGGISVPSVKDAKLKSRAGSWKPLEEAAWFVPLGSGLDDMVRMVRRFDDGVGQMLDVSAW